MSWRSPLWPAWEEEGAHAATEFAQAQVGKPLAVCTLGLGVLGDIIGGAGGAALGSSTGLLGSTLIGNKVQTGHFSPSLTEIRKGK